MLPKNVQLCHSAQLAPHSNRNGLRQQRSGADWTSPLSAFAVNRPRTRRHIEHSSLTYGSSGPVMCALQVSMNRRRRYTRPSGDTEDCFFWDHASVEIWNMRLSGDSAPTATPGRCVRLGCGLVTCRCYSPFDFPSSAKIAVFGRIPSFGDCWPFAKNPHSDAMKKRGTTPNDAP